MDLDKKDRNFRPENDNNGSAREYTAPNRHRNPIKKVHLGDERSAILNRYVVISYPPPSIYAPQIFCVTSYWLCFLQSVLCKILSKSISNTKYKILIKSKKKSKSFIYD